MFSQTPHLNASRVQPSPRKTRSELDVGALLDATRVGWGHRASPRSLGFRVAVHEEEEGAKDSPRQGGGPGAEPPERRRRAPAVTKGAALRHQGANERTQHRRNPKNDDFRDFAPHENAPSKQSKTQKKRLGYPGAY